MGRLTSVRSLGGMNAEWTEDDRYVYIGRGRGALGWGNPFRLGEKCGWCGSTHGEKGQALACYESWLRRRIWNEPDLVERIWGLAGRTLVCWCTAPPCHGEVLLRVIDEIGIVRAGLEEGAAWRNAAGERRRGDRDCYETPDWVADAAVRWAKDLGARSIVDPGAGSGQIVRSALRHGLRGGGLEVRGGDPSLSILEGDFWDWRALSRVVVGEIPLPATGISATVVASTGETGDGGVEGAEVGKSGAGAGLPSPGCHAAGRLAIVANPPYSSAFAWYVAIRKIGDGLGFPWAVLMPIGRLFGVRRASWWMREGFRGLMVLTPRPSFSGSGNAHEDVAWFLAENVVKWVSRDSFS